MEMEPEVESEEGAKEIGADGSLLEDDVLDGEENAPEAKQGPSTLPNARQALEEANIELEGATVSRGGVELQPPMELPTKALYEARVVRIPTGLNVYTEVEKRRRRMESWEPRP